MKTPHTLLLLAIVFSLSGRLFAQITPIQQYAINADGQVEITVQSDPNDYYILKVQSTPQGDFDLPVAIAPGQAGTTILTESLRAYPLERYQVEAHPRSQPTDTDGDGTDDLTELAQYPDNSPLNAAPLVDPEDGVLLIDSFQTFNRLSVLKEHIPWSEYLNGVRYARFIITDFYTAPKVYFINNNLHSIHADFADKIGIDNVGDHVKKGQIAYRPTVIADNGSPGTFTFNYSNGHGDSYAVVERTHELLAINMPLLTNNLSYYITFNNEDEYDEEMDLYNTGRLPIVFEADLYGEVDYWGLNHAEGYGYFRKMSLDETPGPRDIVYYDGLPNTLPQVGGIMTGFIQTPLSHVNLRAIQDGIPNAFIRNALDIDSIANLLDQYVYYRVEADEYTIRSASLAEVNAWYEDLRPKEVQRPPLNLDYQDILPLDEISFSMYDGFGVKCANVATMRQFGFPEGTIPDGYGVPFYFYQEFMEHNGFFAEAENMITDPDFIADRDIREDRLKAFRQRIKAAQLPDWMMTELSDLQTAFPEGTSIRCRSSTNNEDLPGFNGAGLYTSKTQHPHEGHIAKSIKQVYASLWNLRAYEARDFYRVDHAAVAMGVLCHPNYTDEKVNGVGVSTDPVYQTEDAFYYLNSQVGEDLITNPAENSSPEEILLDKVVASNSDYIIVRRSNLVPDDEQVLQEVYLSQLRDYLGVIHDNFAELYEATDNPTFAMEIEYKVTADDQLAIKQARPWVTYRPSVPTPPITPLETFVLLPNPAQDYLLIRTDAKALSEVIITDMAGRLIFQQRITTESTTEWPLDVSQLAPGAYVLTASFVGDPKRQSKVFVKM